MSAESDDPAWHPPGLRFLPVRVLQFAALIPATAGLFLLYLFSVRRELPLVPTGSVAPTMNFACVRMAGEVTRDAAVLSSGGLVFHLNDGSGEIVVRGGRAQAEALAESDGLPRRGDRAEVAGTLSIRAGEDPLLRMHSSRQLFLRRSPVPDPPHRFPAALTMGLNGSRQIVAGRLIAVELPGPGSAAPCILTLQEEDATLEAVLHEVVFRSLEKNFPAPGAYVRVAGTAEISSGAPRLQVRAPTDFSVLTEHEYHRQAVGRSVRRIADLHNGLAGGEVTVCGLLRGSRTVRGGILWTLVDESGEISLVLWDRLIPPDERAALVAGTRVRVTAPLSVYKGRPELTPVASKHLVAEATP
jgi:DNA/RNA endonuclease YhcR with UshA esterase domain